MKNSLLLILALCSASVLTSPVDNSPSLPLQDSVEDLTTCVSHKLKNSDKDTNTVQESHLQNINRDSLLEVFSRITFPEVIRFRATSKSFQSISTETVELPFLDKIRNYNRNDLTDKRLIPLLRQAFPYHDETSSWVELARLITRFASDMRTFEQVLVALYRTESLSVGHIRNQVIERVESALTTLEESLQTLPNLQMENALESALTKFLKISEVELQDVSQLDELVKSSLSTLKGLLCSLANSGGSEVKNHVESALTTLQESLPSWPQNESQVKDLVVSALKQVEESFKNDKYDLDHNDQSEMELEVASILHRNYGPILFARPSIKAAEDTAKDYYDISALLEILDLNDEYTANFERSKLETLGPAILGLLYILQALRGFEEKADVEAEMIALLVPELGMDQKSIEKVFEQARWSVKLGFAVKYKLAFAVRGLLKVTEEVFGPTEQTQHNAAGLTIQKQYNAAIKSKCEPLIKAFEDTGFVKTTDPETNGKKRKETESGGAIPKDI